MTRLFLFFLAMLPAQLPAQCNPDLQPPTISVFNGLAFSISPLTNTANVSAPPLVMWLLDNCDGTLTIDLALRKTGTGTGFPLTPQGTPQSSVSFFCNELGARSLELWARDQAGNAAFVPVTVIIQDNSGTCQPASIDTLCTFFRTTELVEQITWMFEGVPPNPPIPPFADYGTGSCFLIRDFWEDYPAADPNWAVYPQRDETGCNGIDALDLYHIHRHVLGLEPLDNPLKMLAADVNNSRSITGFDLVEIRRLLLGIYNELPGSADWKFFRTDSLPGATNPTNPFQNLTDVPLSVRLGQLQHQNIDFIGIRAGDVDFSASPAFPPVVLPPGDPDVWLTYPNTFTTAGDTVLIPFYLSQAYTLAALQINIQYDTNRFKLLQPITGTYFNSGFDNFGVFSDRLTAVAYGYFPELIPDNEPLFSLEMIALQDGPPAQAFSILNSGCPLSLAFDANLAAHVIGLQPGGSTLTPDISSGNSLCQVYPNPASDMVWVKTPCSGAFQVEWFDLLGRRILLQQPVETPILLKTGHISNGLYWLQLTDATTGRKYRNPVLINR